MDALGIIGLALAALIIYLAIIGRKEIEKMVDADFSPTDCDDTLKHIPKFVIELEGPFQTVEELKSTVAQYKEFNEWAIMVDDELVKNFPTDRAVSEGFILFYERIGKKIYRR